MKMNRIHDDEQGTTTYKIPGFEFEAVLLKGALPPALMGIHIQDKGGIVEADVVPNESAESSAIKMLWNFYRGFAEGEVIAA